MKPTLHEYMFGEEKEWIDKVREGRKGGEEKGERERKRERVRGTGGEREGEWSPDLLLVLMKL